MFPISPTAGAAVQSNQAGPSSVVFASAYRTSVLFTYNPLDSSYTLAPTVGWTAIEMSAGIVSANLPTMLPTLKWFIRAIGLKSLTNTLRSTYATGSKPTGSRSAFTHELSSRDPAVGKMSDSRGNLKRDSFYRLPDDTDSDGERGMGAHDLNLRPDKQKFEVTVNTARDDRDDDDDFALNRICVQKEVRQTSHIV